MKRMQPAAIALSVALFVALSSLTLALVLRGWSDTGEAHTEDETLTSSGGDNLVVLGIKIEDPIVDCIDSSPSLRLVATSLDALPANTTLTAGPVAPTDRPDEFTAPVGVEVVPVSIDEQDSVSIEIPGSAGEALDASTSLVEGALPDSVLSPGYGEIQVWLTASDGDITLQSNTILIEAEAVVC